MRNISMKNIFSASVFLFSGLFTQVAFSNVNLKTGNFFAGYTDIVYPGGAETKIERVYNAKTAFKGMFGWGWGNEYEVYLSVSADGSVVVHEYGGGAENRFSPAAFKESELVKAVDTISNVAQGVGALGSAQQVAEYRKRLRSDAQFRNDEWQKYVRQGKVKPRQLSEGTQLVSNQFNYQYITRGKNGYIRTYDSGKVEHFDERGKLARVQDQNGNFLSFSYGSDGRIQRIQDNFNRKMFFTFNSRGLVEKIQGENGKVAAYSYNALDELVESKDVDGHLFGYKYSNDKRHNMVEIGYQDKTKLELTYYGRDLFENIKSRRDRDGTLTEYFYSYDKKDRGHSTVKVAVKTKDGKPISNSGYEYFIKYKPSGEEWTYKLVSNLDGDRTETVYNECCGLPLLIKRGSEETAFEYDPKGRVTKKITPTDITKLEYHAKVGKVTRVERFSKVNKTDRDWSQFQYDDKGNLVFAKNSAGKGVKLVYDRSGRIQTMIDQAKRQIQFQYNENAKPVRITDPQLGSITVSYTNSGEIKKVESSAGRRIALQVTSAFQNLLDIIRPAGVSLSF